MSTTPSKTRADEEHDPIGPWGQNKATSQETGGLSAKLRSNSTYPMSQSSGSKATKKSQSDSESDRKGYGMYEIHTISRGGFGDFTREANKPSEAQLHQDRSRSDHSRIPFLSSVLDLLIVSEIMKAEPPTSHPYIV